MAAVGPFMHCESTVRIKGSMSAMAQPMESTMDRWRVCLTPAQASSSPIPPQPQSTQPQCHRPETQPQPSKRRTFPPPSCPGNCPHQSPGVATLSPRRCFSPPEPAPFVSHLQCAQLTSRKPKKRCISLKSVQVRRFSSGHDPPRSATISAASDSKGTSGNRSKLPSVLSAGRLTA